MNPMQTTAITGLIAALQTVRNLKAAFMIVPNEQVPTVSNYAVNPLSVCFQLQGTDENGKPNGENLPNFPVIECRKTGKFSLPSIRSYKESGAQNTLQPYPSGVTAFDAALFADSHVLKQNGAWLRRSPQAATAAIIAAVSAPAPATVSAETGKDTAKLLNEIQGKGDKSKTVTK